MNEIVQRDRATLTLLHPSTSAWVSSIVHLFLGFRTFVGGPALEEEGSPCGVEGSGGGGERDELALLVEWELLLVVDEDVDGIMDDEGFGGTRNSPLLALALPPGLLVETVAARRRLLLLPPAAAVA